jgi:hypothetical protein
MIKSYLKLKLIMEERFNFINYIKYKLSITKNKEFTIIYHKLNNLLSDENLILFQNINTKK